MPQHTLLALSQALFKMASMPAKAAETSPHLPPLFAQENSGDS